MRPDVRDMSFPRMRSYAALHQFGFIPATVSECPQGVKPHWNKLLILDRLFQQPDSPAYFLWMDHDVIIASPGFDPVALSESTGFRDDPNALFPHGRGPRPSHLTLQYRE